MRVVVFVVFVVVFAVVKLEIVVFSKNNRLLWHRVMAVSAPRMTSENPFRRQVKSLERSMLAKGFQGIL